MLARRARRHARGRGWNRTGVRVGIETEGEAIAYRLRTSRDGGPVGPIVLAGPTCDADDVIYQHTRYDLPLDLEAGDHVDILHAGAYTSSYSSVCFNGFPPLATYCI